MGKRRGVEDTAFATHESFYKTMSHLCDVLLIENVPEYPVSIIEDHLGTEWGIKHAILDPRAFGVPASRARLYALCWRKACVRWREEIVVEEMLDLFTAQVVSDASLFYWKKLPASVLTPSQAALLFIARFVIILMQFVVDLNVLLCF